VPDPAPVDQVPPSPPVADPGVPGRNRIVVGAAGLGLIALAVVLLTLPTGEQTRTAAPPPNATRSPAVPAGAAPPVTPAVAPPSPVSAPAQTTPTLKTTPPPSPAAAPPATADIAIAASLPRNAVIKVDGKSMARRRLTVNVGRHVLAISQPGYLSRTDTVQVSAGQHFVWSPNLVPAPQRNVAAVPEPAPRRGSADEVACRQNMESASWRDALGSCLRAAQAGSAAAQRSVAALFQRGNGVTRSDDSAARWFAQAARNGDSEAMFQLAVAYDRGRGVKKDQVAALDWYTRAGNAGHADAAYAVGEAFEKGHLGVPKDRAKALDWYRKAAALGSKDAANKVPKLER
jgi:hypothetical protein